MVEIGNGVTSINRFAFEDCNALANVYITNLAAWCNLSFYNSKANPLCYGAKLYLNNKEVVDLIIPNGISEIEEYAFYGCGSIETVKIPNSVALIGEYAFWGCSIKECYCYATLPPSFGVTGNGTTPFHNIKEGATLYVPARCGAAYKSSSWGRNFKNIVEMD